MNLIEKRIAIQRYNERENRTKFTHCDSRALLHIIISTGITRTKCFKSFCNLYTSFGFILFSSLEAWTHGRMGAWAHVCLRVLNLFFYL